MLENELLLSACTAFFKKNIKNHLFILVIKSVRFTKYDLIITKPNWLQGWYYGRRAKFIGQYFN